MMKTQDIEALHDRAAVLYVAGKYPEAMKVWEEILSASPGDERAAEGVKMIGILSGRPRVEEASPARRAMGGMPAGSEIAHVEQLLAEARYREAADRTRGLAQKYPDSGEARTLAERAEQQLEAEPFVIGEIVSARAARDSGNAEEMIRACRRVLALDPEHREAAAMLAAAGSAQTLAPQPAATGEPLPELRLEDLVPERIEAALEAPSPGLRVAPESAGGSLFEIPPEEPGHEGGPPGPAPLFGLPGDGGEVAAPAKWDFSELDAEIDESLSDVEAATAAGAAPAGAPPAGTTSPAPSVETPAREAGAHVEEGPSAEKHDDLSFAESATGGGGDSSWLDEAPAAPPAAAASAATPSDDPQAKIAILLGEARVLIDSGKYDEAIETASRAFVIDRDAPGAQELIEESRARLEERDRVVERNLYEAQSAIDTRDFEGAESLLRDIVRQIPNHREAIDLLADVSRRVAAKSAGTTVTREAPPEAEEDFTIPAPAAATRPPEPAIPVAEPFTPRPHATEPAGATPKPAVQRAPFSIPPTEGRSGVGRRVVIAGVVIALLATIGLGGAYLLPRFTSTGRTESPAAEPLPPKAPPRKQVIRLDRSKQEPAPSPARATTAPPAPATGPAHTLAEGKSLAADGKLDEARTVLADLVAHDPGNIQAIDALKSVQDKINQRDQTAKAMEGIRSAFKQERYDDALRLLYRLPDSMQRGEVELYKRNAWYNDAILFLLGGNCTQAIKQLDEALALDPRDDEARRLKEYAKSYLTREKDTSYRIYVEGLPKRPLEAH